MTFKIQDAKDVPDNPVRPSGRRSIYPFAGMKVGQVFVVPADHPGTSQATSNGMSRVGQAAHAYGKHNNMKFKTGRQVDGSVRVERIA